MSCSFSVEIIYLYNQQENNKFRFIKINLSNYPVIQFSMLRNNLRIFKDIRTLPVSLKSECYQRGLHMTSVKYKDQSEKQIGSLIERTRQDLEADKKDLQWRTPIDDYPNQWKTKFRYFANENQTSDFMVLMQTPIDFRPKTIAKWWKRLKENKTRIMQQYIPERVEILGEDLAAAHFLLHRGGAVKFVGNSNWMKADKDGNFNLPDKFDERFKVEALRCDNMQLYYEGLDNLRCLQHLKFLSFHNVKLFDDFCLDRVSGSQYPCLEVLDISGTKVTANGLVCLYRVPTLKLLIVDDQKQSLNYELMCAVLQNGIPKLNVADYSTLQGSKEEKNLVN